jgi:hypothetical protein
VELAKVEARLAAGQVSVCRGGRRLAKLRHSLDEAKLTKSEWHARWRAERLFLVADGEANKRWGNETIRVNSDQQWLELRLPNPLAQLSNFTDVRQVGREPLVAVGAASPFEE